MRQQQQADDHAVADGTRYGSLDLPIVVENGTDAGDGGEATKRQPAATGQMGRRSVATVKANRT
jgi:hypothetical protein